jgi:molybdate-binding protein/DNA-binding XRE family transcriptional regulator
MEVRNHLAARRLQRGLSAADLAKAAGVMRQTIYAMEAGDYIPNTAVALRLARALDATVEELFALPEPAPASALRREQAMLLPGSGALEAGQPVQLCRIGKRLLASAPSPVPWYIPSSDAIASARPAASGKLHVEIHFDDPSFRNRILIAGCDPGISVLARHTEAAGVELVLAHRNSSQALELLKENCVHIAGVHLRDEPSGESNVPAIARLFARNSVAVISFALWEEGIVTAAGNPKGIRRVEDLARRDVVMVNREPGAGSRLLLDTRLEQLHMDARRVRGYARTAPGHLAAAWQVRSGAVDCCIATGVAARVYGLGFAPLVSERYDLAIRRAHLDLPGVQALLDTLNRARFRRELESIGGYDMQPAGRRVI